MLLLLSFSSFACKEFTLGDTFPVEDFSDFSYILVVKIDSTIHKESGYMGLVSFDAEVSEQIKGDLNVGDKFSGKALREIAHAVCPVNLKDGESYLLLLNYQDNGYVLSRFSSPVSINNVRFSAYLEQVKNAYNKPFKQDK
ncbi:hypothetical protein [Colwellia sp. MB02u-14]|uniref:hypothetical protein n=1 Tax=Colwellia sp. MB02u-14 TaxID=2759815 RepID=UPI0015F493CE|nr:hypothetical protein [Colwellia sp. MB02u-14]MBA6302358.1 hypothetical protein [Colwellia sp. MB02u-14]